MKVIKNTLFRGLCLTVLAVAACRPARIEEVATSSTQLAPPQSPKQASTSKSGTLPAARNFTLAVRHANGTRLQIRKIAFAQDHIALEFLVTNGYEEAIELNRSETLLQDNLGNTYEIVPPLENPHLEIFSGETINGTLLFLGRIEPMAASLKLIVNRNGSNGKRANDPKLTVTNISIESF